MHTAIKHAPRKKPGDFALGSYWISLHTSFRAIRAQRRAMAQNKRARKKEVSLSSSAEN